MTRRIGCWLVLVAVAACDNSSSSSSPPTDHDDGGTDNQNIGCCSVMPPPPNVCPQPTSPAVQHAASVSADETWAAGLHDITGDFAIQKGATLTIQPCAVVRIAADHRFEVGDSTVGGKLIAKGRADMPIVFQGLDDGHWAALQVDYTGFADLAYVTIKGAGNKLLTRGGAGGALHLFGLLEGPVVELVRVDHVTIDGADRYGAVLEGRAAFASGSQNLTIKGSGELAMRANTVAAGSIPSGNYTGNATDAIRLVKDTVVDADTTIHDRGVPYFVGGDGYFAEIQVVGATTVPALTIEPGVTMKFPKADRSSVLRVYGSAGVFGNAQGALVAVGRADKPIVFSSSEATPAPGDWLGIELDGVPDPRTSIAYARIEYAGGDTGSSGASCGTPPNTPAPAQVVAAVAIYGQPVGEIVKNTTISNSGANGIERAWTGAPVDFLATNTFENVRFCRQTFPHPPSPAQCPEPAPCD
jgi:hypothetical protein